MDFFSGVPVRNHAFIMGVTYWGGGSIDSITPHAKQLALRFTGDVIGNHFCTEEFAEKKENTSS